MEEKKVRIHLEKHYWPDEIRARRKRNLGRILASVGLVLTFVFGWVVGSTFATGEPVEETTDFAKLEAIYQIMSEDWYFGKDVLELQTKLIDDAINGMVDGGGDIHTSYLTSEEAKQFNDSLNMGFVGIGVQYYDSNGTYIIERVFRGSPAERAGVLPGDIIYKVDGTEVTGIGSDELAAKVKGENGSIVEIDFIREGVTVSKKITRAPINNTAYGEMIDAETALLEIYTFGDTTGNEVMDILDDFESKGAKRLILDLRDNGGGYLSTLETIGSFFVEKGGILIQQEFINGTTDTSKSSGFVTVDWEKIVILVNGNTASASEVLVAALDENLEEKVTVVGTLTYGKGTVQTQRPFSDQSILKYTIAQWLTPSGKKIDGIGITPDVVVELPAIMENGFEPLEEGETITPDSVDDAIVSLQEALSFLGYAVDRQDGYYSPKSVEEFKKYQATYGTIVDGVLTQEWISRLHADVARVWHEEMDTRDTQMAKAVELIHE
ncbi:MAG: S41 family peptidase [Erysipelotrichaceae bacterium]